MPPIDPATLVLAVWTALGIAGALSTLLLTQLRQKNRGESTPPNTNPVTPVAMAMAMPAPPQEVEHTQRVDDLKKALVKTPPLLNYLDRKAKQAGTLHTLHQGALDSWLVEDVSNELRLEALNVLEIAATQTEIQFDLGGTTTEDMPSHTTEGYLMPGAFDDPSQLTDLLPEQMATLGTESFGMLFLSGEIRAQRRFVTLKHQRTLYILMDFSGSMRGGFMPRSMVPRHIWARAIACSLLSRALQGDARYLLRSFDSAPHELRRITTTTEADDLFTWLLYTRPPGNAGTCIWEAVKTAVEDITSGNVEEADILVITDGEDESMDNTDQVRELLGKNIKLHAVLIGVESPALKQVAETYLPFM